MRWVRIALFALVPFVLGILFVWLLLWYFANRKIR